MEHQGATAVITHHIKKGKQEEYENWLDQIGPGCRSSAGFIDWQIIRPIPNLTVAYTVIIRFDTILNLTNWMESKERKEMIRKATPLLAKDDNYHIHDGLDFLFMTGTENSKIPVRWKQYLATWSAIYPLSVIIPLIIIPQLRRLSLSPNRFIDAAFVSAIIVFMMVYLVMPSYTKLIKKWLYN